MDLWIFVNSSLHKYPLKNRDDEIITVGNGVKDMIRIQSVQFGETSLLLKKVENEWVVFKGDEQIGCLHIGRPFTFKVNRDSVEFVLTKMENERVYYIGDRTEISFSSQDGDVEIHSLNGNSNCSFSLYKQAKKWMIDLREYDYLFLNGKRIDTPKKLNKGDVLFFPFMTIAMLDEDLIQINSSDDYRTVLTETAIPISKMKSRYPLFQRTPRLIYEAPKDKVMMSFPMQDSEEDNRGLWLIILPPLVMLLVIGFIAIINPRGIFMLISIMMFTMTIFTSTVQYFRDKKKHKNRSEKRLKVYTRYLEDKREELDVLYQKQKQVAHYHFPAFEEMKDFVTQISNRIWERTFHDADFLQVRIGKADVRSTYEININSNDLANREIDHLI
ncbi:MAG: FtsK/SpoIIIE N-terminal domain-containing protein, partial [Bacillus sp. (in: firmicutes)]